MKSFYYAIIYDSENKEFFVIKSEDLFLIQDKISSALEFPFHHLSYCKFAPKATVDRLQRRYNWAIGGEVYLRPLQKRYDIYIHKCNSKIKRLPTFNFGPQSGDDFISKDIIKDALSVTFLEKKDTVSSHHMMKKCQVRFVLLTSGSVLFEVKP